MVGLPSTERTGLSIDYLFRVNLLEFHEYPGLLGKSFSF